MLGIVCFCKHVKIWVAVQQGLSRLYVAIRMPISPWYFGHINQVLWPTFHYVVPDDAKSKVYQEDAWKKYKALNERFAATIIKNYQPGDISKLA